MKTFISKKFICCPVNPLATSKKICFYKNVDGVRTLVMDLDCKLDTLTPEFVMYEDVSRFMGDELEYTSIPEMEFELSQSETMELDGLCDIDEALLLKNKTVYATRKDFKLAKGEYFICDIIGLEVILVVV